MASNGPSRPVGRPAQLSREQIVDAVRGVDNVDALTMRALAARLGVSHGALYRWVRNRDELFDLISAVVIERVLADDRPGAAWRPRLAAIAWAMHDQFGAVPGYATHLARPHEHNAHSTARLHEVVVAAFARAGVDPELAEHSWYIFVTGVVSWLAFQEQSVGLGPATPRFELFLDVLLRGLPAREVARPRK
jgi:AcrR family transcriptional regulator